MKKFLLFLSFSLLCYALIYLMLFQIPSYQNVVSSYQSSEKIIYDRHKRFLSSTRVSFDNRKLPWTKLKDFSPYLIKSVTAIEDKRFYRHYGVDFISLANSAGALFYLKRPRGASTITMQLVSLLFKDRFQRSCKSVFDKIFQIAIAIKIDLLWSKSEILETYLNLVPLKGEIIGAHTASVAFFKKEVNYLDEEQSIVIASMIKKPNQDNLSLLNRSLFFIKKIFPKSQNRYSKFKHIISEEITNTIHKEKNREQLLLPYTVLQSLPNGKIYTTIDSKIQKQIQEIVFNHVSILKRENLNDLGVIVIENESGEILSYIPGTKSLSNNPYVDSVTALRQAGSTYKPFIYGLAIEKRLITSASIFNDSPVNFLTNHSLYNPKNYDQLYNGNVTSRVALASSLNIPAIKALKIVGINPFIDLLKRLDIDVPFSDNFYGLSLALGTCETTLWKLTNAYRALANNGIWSPLSLLKNEPSNEQRRVLSRETSFIINDILSDNKARSITFGTNSILQRPYWSAVKTGTSKDMRDNWCIGHDGNFTVGVWAGNLDGTPMYHVNGLTGAGPIWAKVMDILHKNSKNIYTAKQPDGVVKRVVSHNGHKFSEYFLKGSEFSSIETVKFEETHTPSILYPFDGMVVAIDPDIPIANQLIILKSDGDKNLVRWQLNGKELENTNSYLTPSKGHHTLTLLTKRGKISDKIQFFVK
jgi:penicillin-binding protein 1C